jgi:hypothetical protein
MFWVKELLIGGTWSKAKVYGKGDRDYDLCMNCSRTIPPVRNTRSTVWRDTCP